MANGVDVVENVEVKAKASKKKAKKQQKEQKVKEPLKELNPTLDLKENPNEFLLIIEMPGLSKKDVKVQLNVDTLTIKGKKRKPKGIKKENTNIEECEYGVFTRTINLPDTVNPKKVSAKIKNGRFVIEMPKKNYQKSLKIKVD